MRCLPVLAALFLLALAPAAKGQGCSHHLFVSGYFSSNVAIYDACSGAFLRQLETAGRIRGAQAVRLNPVDGLIYVVSEGNDQIQRYRRDANYTFVDVFAQLPANIDPTGIDFSAAGRVFVASYRTSRVLELDRATGQAIGDVLPAGSGLIGADNGMMVSAAGLLYVPGYDSHSIARVNLATAQVQGAFVSPGSGGIVNARGILDQGTTILVTGEGSGAVYRYDAGTGAFVSRLVGGMTRPTGIAIGTDGALLVLWDEQVHKYDRNTGASLGILANGVNGGISGGTFLAVLPNPANDRNLSIARVGDGSGTVTSSPSGINCGSTCSASFVNGAQVTLTATPAAGNRFNGWSGACSGTSSTCAVTMDQARSASASFVPNAPPSATLRFDSATGPTTKTIVQNSGTPVTFAWKTTGLPSGTTCKILRRPNDDYNAAASPASGGTRTDPNISAWSVGAKVFYPRCSNGTVSPDITLTISGGTPSATLRFDSASGPTSKTIVRNSGTPVTFAWKTTNLPSGATCKIVRRPDDSYGKSASPAAGGTVTDTNIHTWAVGTKALYLRCSNGTTSPDITLTISGGTPSATLRFDSVTGPTAKTIVRNSGTPVTFAWKTANLPSGATCRIVRRPDDSYGKSASPVASGTVADTNIHTWAVGIKTLYLRCSNGTTSPDITLTITQPSTTPTATLRFDSATGPTTKTIVRNSGTPVTFAWKTTSLPSGATCKILRRPNDDYSAAASPASGGTRTDPNISTWSVGNKVLYLRCSNGTVSPDITLAISSSSYVLSVQKTGTGSGTVTSSPVGINCGSTCSASFAINATVTLTATADGGNSVFTGWSGACSGTGSTCAVTMSTAKTVGAIFSDLGASAQTISVGHDHTCALTAAGAVKCWGRNDAGQIGDGTTTDRPTPVAVSGLSSGVQAISAGYEHTCALTTAGAVKCWGFNGGGQLGDGTATDRLMPIAVSGLSNGVQAISAGGDHTCALTAAGAVKCWGYNAAGQLGDGTQSNYRLTPVAVSGLSSGVQAISAGYEHTCALTTDGAVWCWGDNQAGALGDGTTTDRVTPVTVSGLSSGVQAISAGIAHTCALTTAGAVTCWGANDDGQLGDGTTTDRLTPVAVSGLSNGVQAISAEYEHTCALTTVGAVKCWGYNGAGQLGDGTMTDRLTPVMVSELSSGVQAISAGGFHTCALPVAGAVTCWGHNVSGQLGDDTTTDRLTPVAVSGLDGGE